MYFLFIHIQLIKNYPVAYADYLGQFQQTAQPANLPGELGELIYKRSASTPAFEGDEDIFDLKKIRIATEASYLGFSQSNLISPSFSF